MNLEDILSNKQPEEDLNIKSCDVRKPEDDESFREYVVTLHKHEDLESFYNDMAGELGDEYIPARSVERTNKRPLSRNTHYILTHSEAEQIKQDPRVWDVDLTMEEKGVVAVPLGSTTITNGVFARKSSGFSNTDLNWGLLAHGNPAVVSSLDEAGTDFPNSLGQASYSTWGSDRTGNATASVRIPFNGENVDVVIIDDEIPPLHPEFAANPDGSGGSRVNQIDWWGLYRSVVQTIDDDVVDASVPSTYTYGDYGDHGTHVAGTAVGNRLGWARKANIYNLYAYNSVKVPPSLMYDLLRAFHLNKPVNPTTGRRNPTITNHSYGYSVTIPITQITQFVYRGSTRNVSYTNTQSDLNLIRRDYGLWGGQITTFVFGSYPTQSAQWCVLIPFRGGIAQQADIEDAINDGLIFVAAAGNYGDTSVDPSHPDYNNQVTYNYQSPNSSQTNIGFISLYKQGTDPAGVPSSITVGNLTTDAALKLSVSTGDNDQVWVEFKNNSSSHGNTCDIWAAGTNILSSVYTSQTLKDPRNNSYSLNVLSGTSMASPQIAGMIACLAERYPRFKQSDFLNLLKSYGYNYPRVFPGVYHKHYVTNNGTTSYNFTANADRIFERNGSNQSFDIRIGEIVEFSVNTPGQPFWIKTLQITGTSNAVTTGVTNNGATSGSIIWDTTNMAPGIYYYISQNSSTMTGTITLRYSQLDRTYTAVGSRTQPYALFPTTLRKSSGYVTPDVAESPRPTSGLAFPRKRIWQTGTTGGSSSTSSAVETYSISSSTTTVNEGSSVTFTLSTTNVPNATTLYWTINGTTSNTDFSDQFSSSSFLTTNDSTIITRTLLNDLTTEGFETFYLEVRTGSINGPIVATSPTISVNDSSITPAPTYTISQDTTTVSEGSSVTFTLTTTNVPNATTLYWTTGGDVSNTDFTDLLSSSSFLTTNNSTTIVRTLRNDLNTEGTELFNLQIRTDSISGPVVATSSTITVIDTSTTPIPAPTISLSASPSTVTLNNPEATRSSVLSWSSTNATSVISSNFGASSVNGSTTVSPFSATNYSISVSGPGGTASANTTVNVNTCVVPSGTSTYGSGFGGYLLYGNGLRAAADNGSTLFVTSINSLYGSIGSQITTAGGVVTTYSTVASVIINHYISNLSRYPEGPGFDGWFFDFLNNPGYTSFSVLTNAINTAFFQAGGEFSIRQSRGGLVGNFDSCNNRRL